MGQIVKIPVTGPMKNDKKECSNTGAEKSCEGCSCYVPGLGCLAEYPWCDDDDDELMKQAITNCHMVNLHGIEPGMENGMCAGLRTMNGKGEPCWECQECRLQYQYTETHN